MTNGLINIQNIYEKNDRLKPDLKHIQQTV